MARPLSANQMGVARTAHHLVEGVRFSGRPCKLFGVNLCERAHANTELAAYRILHHNKQPVFAIEVVDEKSFASGCVSV